MVAVLEHPANITQQTQFAQLTQKLMWFPGKSKRAGSVLVFHHPCSKVISDKTFLLKCIEAWPFSTFSPRKDEQHSTP